jgi:hypothetical protein
MSAVEELAKERAQARSDLLAGKKPKRLFIAPNFTMEAACGLANVNLIEAHYNAVCVNNAALRNHRGEVQRIRRA